MSKSDIRQFIMRTFPLARSRGVSDESPLLESGILDSMGVLEVVTFIQDELGITVEDTDLVPENFQSIDVIAAFVEVKTGAPGADS